jgi:hypothetical protein
MVGAFIVCRRYGPISIKRSTQNAIKQNLKQYESASSVYGDQYQYSPNQLHSMAVSSQLATTSIVKAHENPPEAVEDSHHRYLDDEDHIEHSLLCTNV